ncbi:VPA1269 family protein [Vibrio sp. 10N.286.48.C11]|uniref:VPA1269 family protein n=1 Tax=Vibrio sp. 10N.286.48.C11 TaxID=3229698 RepID=UPI00354FE5DC
MIVVNEKDATSVNTENGYMSEREVYYNSSMDEAVMIRTPSIEEFLAEIDTDYALQNDPDVNPCLKAKRDGFVHPSLLNLRELGAESTQQLLQFAIDLAAEAKQESTKIGYDLRQISKLIQKGAISGRIEDFKDRKLYKLLCILRPKFRFKNNEFDFGDEISIDNAIQRKHFNTKQQSTLFNSQLFHIVSMFKDLITYSVAKRIIIIPAYSLGEYMCRSPYHTLKMLSNAVIFEESTLAIDSFFEMDYRGQNEHTSSARKFKEKAVAQLFSASVVESLADVPYKMLTDINQTRFGDKGYNSTSGSFTKPLATLIEQLERQDSWTSESNYRSFDKSLVRVQSAIRKQNHDLERSNASLGYAVGKIDEPLRLRLSKLCENLSGENIKRAGLFVDYLTYLEEQGKSVQNLNELSHRHFHDSLNLLDVKSFFDFFCERQGSNAYATRVANWQSIRSLYESMIREEEAIYLRAFDRNMPNARVMFGGRGSNSGAGVTVRASMSSLLHEMCIELLTADNYAFAREHSSHHYTVASQYNYETKEWDKDIFHPNVAHALHLLLIFPARTHQILWSDEGLMDELTYDHDKKEFVENTHPMRNKAFITKYEVGTHAELFKSQGFVVPDGTNQGEICLHFNTNKTKLITLQKEGKTGYLVPWMKESGIGHLDDVLKVVNLQKEFNRKYSPRDLVPVNPMDRHSGTYGRDVYDLLPMGTPLFRDLRNPTISNFNPEKTGLYLPVSNASVRKLFIKLLDAVDKEYAARFGATKSCVRDRNGEHIYDLHGLRVFGITDLLKKGVEPSVVQMLVGHATEIMTMYYKKLSNEEFRKVVLEARKNAGQAPQNIREYIENHADDELIALFDLLPEWNEHGHLRPDFSLGGRPTRMKGGICSQFDCKSGGIEINVINSKAEEVKITPIKAGAMTCGNCRYWRSAPELIADQIYYINLLAVEIHELALERIRLMDKSQDVFNDEAVSEEAARLASESFLAKADETTEKSIYKIVERMNRKQMFNECVNRLSEKIGMQLPTISGNDSEVRLDLSESEKCMELLIQATAQGIDQEDSISMRKVQRFLAQLYSATNNENPFLFMPSDEVKQLAVVSKMYEAQTLLGGVDDMSFEDPRLLIDTIESEQLQLLQKTLREDTALLLAPTIKE